MKIKRIEILGKKFGKLTVLNFEESVLYGKRDWKTMVKCKCDCGKEKILRLTFVKNMKTVSCGCSMTKHNASNTEEYKIFCRAKHRCVNKNLKEYKHYGARGIKFNYKNFYEFFDDLGKRPSKKHSVDRIDNSSHYEKGNCKWSTYTEQANNRRRNCVKYNGETTTEASKRLGGNRCLVSNRLRKGLSAVEAFNMPIRRELK